MSRTLKTCNAGLAGWAVAAILAVAAAPVAAQAQTTPNAPGPQSSADGGVTIKAVPKSLGGADNLWRFSIVLDTHSADLSDDLAQSATLTTDDGRTLKPLNWTGAAPGGHHREGVLAFEIPPPRPSAIELSIVRPGESAPRLFRWQI